MTMEKEPAACSIRSPEQAARQKHLCKPYFKTVPVSRMKLAIGELLLFGDKQQSEFWPLFEALLVQSYQGSAQSVREGRLIDAESTKSGRG